MTRRQTSTAFIVARTTEAQQRYERAAAEHRARRRWVLEADLQNDNSDFIPEINTDITDQYAGNNDMTMLFQLPFSMRSSWRRLRPKLAQLPPSRYWPVMKTLAGGWATSYRLHVQPDRRGCVFGCDPSCCPDAIAHYMVCKRLWHLVALP